MSLPDGHKTAWGRKPRIAPAGLIALMVVLPLLQACAGGFRPLYGPTASGRHLDDVLAAVKISTIPGRVGQRIRNELIFKTTGGREALTPEYRLEIAIRETVKSALVETTGDVKSEIFSVDAEFKLVRLKSGQAGQGRANSVIYKGKTYSRAAYQRFEDIFANVRARRDAENRAARTIAEGIKSRLAAFLSGAA